MRRLSPILAILLLAAATRIINASHWPAWTDEGWSTWAASDHHLDTILSRVAQDRHPPLYFLALSAWWSVAGYSRIALRFLSIAGGLLTVAAVYRIGADWFGKRGGVYGALLLAVLNIAVYYSQEIRHYSWLMLAISLMTLTFLRYLRRPRPAMLVAYALSIVFMLYTLYIGVFILIVQIPVGLLVWRASWRQKLGLIGAWIAACVLYTPWLVAISQQMNILAGGIDGYPTNLESLLIVGELLFGGQLALTVGLYVVGAWSVVRGGVPLTPSRRKEGKGKAAYSSPSLFTGEGWTFARERGVGDLSVIQTRHLAQITLVLSGAGLLALMFIANLRIGMLSARTLVYLTPMLMLVCGYGLSLIQNRVREVLALMLVVVSVSPQPIIQPRLDSTAAAKALAAEYTPGDLIILEDGWDDNAVRYEVMLALPDSESAEIIRTQPWVKNRGEPNQPVVPHVESAIRTHRRVWVVNWFQPPQVIPYLDAGNDGFVRVLTRQTPTGAQYKGLYDDPAMRVVLFEQPQPGKLDLAYSSNQTDLLTLKDTLMPSSVKQGSTLHVDLWWSGLKPLPLDYSVGVFVQDASGVVRAQNDGPPGDKPTTQWLPGSLEFDRHNISIPADLPAGNYKIGVQVYWYGDRQPLTVGAGKYVILGEIEIQ